MSVISTWNVVRGVAAIEARDVSRIGKEGLCGKYLAKEGPMAMHSLSVQPR